MPHELPNDLRLRTLGNEEISGKPSENYNLVLGLLSQNFLILAKNFWKVDIESFP